MDYYVNVTIVRARALSSNIDDFSAPDMYAKIRIGDSEHKTRYKGDRITVNPTNWSHSVGFMENDFSPPKKIPIRIQLWDRDDIDPDDKIDIDPSEDSKSISVLLSFDTGADTIGMRAGVLYLSDGHTEVPGSVLRRAENIGGLMGDLMPAWETDTIYSKGCDGDRAEISYKVQVTKVTLG